MTESPTLLPDTAPTARRQRRDYRLRGAALVVVTVGALGFLMTRLPDRGTEVSPEPAPVNHGKIKPDVAPFAGIPASPELVLREEAAAQPAKPQSPDEQERKNLRKEARTKLAAKEYFAAMRPLEEIIRRSPGNAEAHLLMALAIQGAGNNELARKYYEAAIDRDPLLADAYFGYATASEALNDLESALGGMRSYLHVQKDGDPYRLRIAQARAAIWEWESKLGRGPWGPTKGIPPGFTEAELKRDGRGMGTKMPIPGTEQPDGSVQYEIKHSDKIEMFKK